MVEMLTEYVVNIRIPRVSILPTLRAYDDWCISRQPTVDKMPVFSTEVAAEAGGVVYVSQTHTP